MFSLKQIKKKECTDDFIPICNDIISNKTWLCRCVNITFNNKSKKIDCICLEDVDTFGIGFEDILFKR